MPPIVQSVQFNREATKDKKGGRLENIGGSDVVGQISTSVITIKAGPSPDEQTKRTLGLEKNREGARELEMDINFLFDPPNFDWLPRPEQQEQGDDTYGADPDEADADDPNPATDQPQYNHFGTDWPSI